MDSLLVSEVEHIAEVEAWQKNRIANLTSDSSWLTLCGLFWLKEGKNVAGNDNENDVIVPKCEKHIANIIVTNREQVSLEPLHGSNKLFTVESDKKKEVLETVELQHDDDSKRSSTLVQVDDGTVTFFIIKRGNRVAVRVKDKLNEARVRFKGIDHFPVNPQARLIATFHPYTPWKELPIKTVLDMDAPEKSPGYLEFVWDGNSYKIDTILESPTDKELFIIIKDKTSGKETYGMRYLLVPTPASLFDTASPGNKVVIDFNKLYNPPCSFTHFATCPLPPPQNVLPFRIEAGEKKYEGPDH